MCVPPGVVAADREEGEWDGCTDVGVRAHQLVQPLRFGLSKVSTKYKVGIYKLERFSSKFI